MHVTVEDGRAVAVAGDPDHPITVGFLCGKVSNYLDRVYSEERILHPLVRAGAKGDGRFERVSWDEALDRVAGGLARAREEFGGESILPYSYMGTQGLIQSNVMSARVMNALGASELERTICASAGMAGTVMAHGVSPEVDPEEWPNARYVLVWGWNPMSTAPHLWRKLLDARTAGARLVVVDPFRSRTARVADEHLRPLPGTDAALGMGMMRAIVDAGLQDEDWCRAYTEGYDELLATLADFPVERAAEISGVDAEAIARVGLEFATTRPALLRLGVGAQRHLGAPAAYSTLASLPALTGAWRERGGGCSYVPKATSSAVSNSALQGTELRPGPVAHDQHVAGRRRADGRPARSAGQGVRLLELEPRGDRARPGAGARRAAPRGPVHGRAGAVHDRHGPARGRGAARHDPARAPRRGVLLGPPLPDLERARDRAGRGGQAEHRGLPATRRAPRPRRPRCSARATRSSPTGCSRASRRTGCASAAGRRSTSARVPCRMPRAAS